MPEPADYAGSAACQSCHQSQFAAWRSSMHAAAMHEATSAGGDALLRGKATFGKDGASSVEFSTGDGAVTASVRERDASAQAHSVRYTLGRRYLEQPVVAGARGRLQALPVAWDAGRKDWFDVFSGEERLAGEFGHWTGRGMNANSQCIECHATGYRTGYDAGSDSYSSAWAEAGVGCEACHGPGAAHVKDPNEPYGPFGSSAGIAAFRPKPAARGEATADSQAGSPSPAASAMHDVCATCHSIRRPIAAGFTPGRRFLDHYEPSLVEEDVYWPDGSVRTEAYEWASFLQSRMHGAGVTCLSCHDVHSGELRAKGNDLCLSCHEPELATRSHTAHEPESAGNQCVSCHMPESTFMARDRRRDHSLGVPDPIGALETGSPSACETCHTERGRDTLAADAERLWPKLKEERYALRRTVARAFADARAGRPVSRAALRDCLTGTTCESSVLRASAARLAGRMPFDAKMEGTMLEALEDEDPLVRSSAAFAFADIDPREPMRRQYLSVAAGDSVRAVRMNAAWALRKIETARLPAEQAASLNVVYEEWRRSQGILADAPETWHTRGIFETARDDVGAAEAAYRRALEIEPRAVASRYNLAMLLVRAGRVDEARGALEVLVETDDSNAEAWFALGMIYGEQKNWPDAARALGRAVSLDPERPGALTDLTHAYLEAGTLNVARAVVSGALGHASVRREALAAMVLVERHAGDEAAAARAASALVSEDPAAANDPEVARLLSLDRAEADGPPAGRPVTP